MDVWPPVVRKCKKRENKIKFNLSKNCYVSNFSRPIIGQRTKHTKQLIISKPKKYITWGLIALENHKNIFIKITANLDGSL